MLWHHTTSNVVNTNLLQLMLQMHWSLHVFDAKGTSLSLWKQCMHELSLLLQTMLLCDSMSHLRQHSRKHHANHAANHDIKEEVPAKEDPGQCCDDCPGRHHDQHQHVAHVSE